MRRKTFLRDLLGTAMMFLILLAVVFVFILGEHFLEAFKSH